MYALAIRQNYGYIQVITTLSHVALALTVSDILEFQILYREKVGQRHYM